MHYVHRNVCFLLASVVTLTLSNFAFAQQFAGHAISNGQPWGSHAHAPNPQQTPTNRYQNQTTRHYGQGQRTMMQQQYAPTQRPLFGPAEANPAQYGQVPYDASRNAQTQIRRLPIVIPATTQLAPADGTAADTQLAGPNTNGAEPIASPSDIRVPVGPDPAQQTQETLPAPNTNNQSVPETAVDPGYQQHVRPGPSSLPEHGAKAALWWESAMQQRMRTDSNAVFVDVQTLVAEALRHSLRLKAIAQTQSIRAEDIIRADAEFDPRAFMEAKFVDSSDPVGNTLITGGPSRLNDHTFTYEAGIQDKTYLGGNIELSQRLGHQNSNSVFFIPQDQGNARLSLSFTQPLLNGAGIAYNTSYLALADINTTIAHDEYVAELQSHLLDVTNAYWQLYMERAVLMQKQRHLNRAQEIMVELQGRLEIDALQSQIVRAQAAVASRRAELARSKAAVRNVESQLRALINGPQYNIRCSPELIPVELPFRNLLNVQLTDAVQTAIKHRPELDKATQKISAATVRLNMSQNEVLPSLSLILESYLSGLEGESRVGRAFTEQFDTGAPSYTIGMRFETPIWNRAACARLRQREIELNQLQLEFQATMEELTSEVEVAVRDVHASFEEMSSKYLAMDATVIELRYLSERWELLPGDDRSASLLLEDILNSQERLMDEETSFVRAQVGYVKSLANLKRATGTLMGCEFLPKGPKVPAAQPALPMQPQPAHQPVMQNRPAPQPIQNRSAAFQRPNVQNNGAMASQMPAHQPVQAYRTASNSPANGPQYSTVRQNPTSHAGIRNVSLRRLPADPAR